MHARMRELVEKYAVEIRSSPDARNLPPDLVRHMALEKAVVQYVEEKFGEGRNNGNNRNKQTSSNKKQASFRLDDNGDESNGD